MIFSQTRMYKLVVTEVSHVSSILLLFPLLLLVLFIQNLFKIVNLAALLNILEQEEQIFCVLKTFRFKLKDETRDQNFLFFIFTYDKQLMFFFN